MGQTESFMGGQTTFALPKGDLNQSWIMKNGFKVRHQIPDRPIGEIAYTWYSRRQETSAMAYSWDSHSTVQYDIAEWAQEPFNGTDFSDFDALMDSASEASASYPCPQQIIVPPWGDTFSAISPNHTQWDDECVTTRLMDGLKVPMLERDWSKHPAPEYRNKQTLMASMRGGVREDPFTRSREMFIALRNQQNCGSELTGGIYCGCSAIPILNRCLHNFCPDCWNHKANGHRKEWRRRLKHDFGFRYEFLTFTMPQRYWWWDVADAVAKAHEALRKLTKSHYWRKTSKTRLWFGVIECKPALSMTELGPIPTFNVHIHMVRSGARMEFDTLREKWINHGGGSWIHGSGPIGIGLKGKRNARKRRVGKVLSYMTGYMTAEMDADSKKAKKWGMSDLPPAIGAYVSSTLKQKQLFFSGGRAWIEAGKRADAVEEYACCSGCGSGIGFEIDSECAETLVDALGPPEDGFWTTTTIPPPIPDPWPEIRQTLGEAKVAWLAR